MQAGAGESLPVEAWGGLTEQSDPASDLRGGCDVCV